MGEKQKKKWSKMVLKERDKGNVVFLAVDEALASPVKEIIKQPTDGLLWDLNRGEETALTFMDREGMTHWVNNFAVALVIRELKSQLDEYKEAERQIAEFGICLEWKEELADYKKHFEPQMIQIRLREKAESEQRKTYTTHSEER